MDEKDDYLKIIGDVLPESPGLSLGLAFAAGAYAVQAAGLQPFAVHFFGPSGTGKTCVATVIDSLEFRSVDLPFTLIDGTKGSLPRKTKLPVISFGERPVDALIDGHCMVDGSEIRNFQWRNDATMDWLLLAAGSPFSIGPRLKAFAEESVPDLRKRYDGFFGEHFVRVARLGMAMLGAVVPTWDLGIATKYLLHLKAAPRPAMKPSVYLTADTANFLDGRAPTLSGALNQSIERYQAILDATELPVFADEEIVAMAEAMGKANPRMVEADELWLEVDRGSMDVATGKVPHKMAKLVETLKKLTVAQAITLRERLEAVRRSWK